MAASTTAVVPPGPIEDTTRHPTSSTKLEDHAALAALYVTKYDSASKNGQDFLNADHKLSSAGAAASLRYANPQDLPSFPSTGLKKNDSAASVAASLGWANRKPVQYWKPDPSASASAAAMKAKDYKMAPLWQPEKSANGTKAALLAHKEGGNVEIWRPEATAWGNSAANQAFKNDRAGRLSPQLNYGHTTIGRQGSLLAATSAISSSRKRAESTPIVAKPETYPDETNAAANALSAATSANKMKRRTEVSSGVGAVPYTTMSREMYTSHPPVAPEVEEQNRQDTLRASAVAMARQMYKYQQKQIDTDTAAHSGANVAHGRKPSTSSSNDVQPMRFNNLQEAAQKLAQERLAKLHDEHAKNREYRDYYGGSSQIPSKLSIRGRTRRRASSDGIMDEDKEQSNKIRAQMSIFSSNLSQIDAKKRQQDREALIAAAQRNVTKSLHGMDERVFAETGKVAPSLLSEWEVKAHAAAQAKSNTRMENYGKINIGGGKFINQSQVDLVAAKNVQPVLDEINEKAVQERARQVELKLEQEKSKLAADEKKAREKEEKAINKKLRDQDKEEEKARKAEQKRLAKGTKEKRKSGKSDTPVAAVVAPKTTEVETETPLVHGEPELEVEHEVEPASATIADRREAAIAPAPIRTSMEDQASMRMAENAAAANKDETTPMSPSSPESGGKVKNWLKTKFSRRLSKNQKPLAQRDIEKGNNKGFVGGAALTGAKANSATASLEAESNGVRDLAMAGKDKEPVVEEPEEERVGRKVARDDEVSPVSSVEDEDEEFQETRDDFNENLAPPPTFPTEKSSSPVRDSKFVEEI